MHKILVANRGEIAVRIFKTCRQMQIGSVAVYSEEDRDALHVSEADEAFCIGPAPVADSYLHGAQILEAARRAGATAVHPGYGFLSEQSSFARAVKDAGLAWIGPPASAMEAMASKIEARRIAINHDVPVVPGMALGAGESLSGPIDLKGIQLPILIKAAAGGGGIGMREVHDADALVDSVLEAREQAERQFGDGDLLLESLLSGARHVEVQIVGDHHGNLIHLFERDCSVQRRRQKLIEEAPAPNLQDETRSALHAAALRLSAAVEYHSVGTVEFIVKGNEFYFLEMNTRLQVEHGVTEAVTGIDLVKTQIEIASGQELALRQESVRCQGHAIESRVYAEEPAAGFRPSVGTIDQFHHANTDSVRIDTGVGVGSSVSRHYDGLLCKLITHAQDRAAATGKMCTALPALCIAGVETNQRFLSKLMRSPAWDEGRIDIGFAEALARQHSGLELDGHELNIILIGATIWHFKQHPPAADQSPWPGGFAIDRITHWIHGDESSAVSWRWLSTNNFSFPEFGKTAQFLKENAEGELALEIDGERFVFRLCRQHSDVYVWTPALGNVILRPELSSRKSRQGGDAAICASPGPGQVLRVLVEPGQRIEAGDVLIVLESMKMETPLTARRNGVVDSVEVEAGVLVESGQVLLRLVADKEEQS